MPIPHRNHAISTGQSYADANGLCHNYSRLFLERAPQINVGNQLLRAIQTWSIYQRLSSKYQASRCYLESNPSYAYCDNAT